MWRAHVQRGAAAIWACLMALQCVRKSMNLGCLPLPWPHPLTASSSSGAMWLSVPWYTEDTCVSPRSIFSARPKSATCGDACSQGMLGRYLLGCGLHTHTRTHTSGGASCDTYVSAAEQCLLPLKSHPLKDNVLGDSTQCDSVPGKEWSTGLLSPPTPGICDS